MESSEKIKRNAKGLRKDGAKWLMRVCKLLLEPISLWPGHQTNIVIFLHILCALTYFFLIFGTVYYILGENSDLALTSSAISTFILVLEAFTRRFLAFFYKKDFNKLLQTIYYEFWPSNCVGEKLSKDIKSRSWFLAGYVFGYTFNSCVATFQFMVEPYFDRVLPYGGTAYPFAWQDVPYYELIYVWISFIAAEIVFNVCFFDLFFLSFVFNCVAQLRLLKAFILQEFQESKRYNGIKRKAILVKCVRHHLLIISACKEIERIFLYYLLILYINGMATTCLGSFVSIAMPTKIGTALTYFMGHTCQLFIYCYWGNELILESQSLARAIYMTDWESTGTDRDFQKSLVLMMLRSQKALSISGGGFGNLSLPTFLSLMQFAFSVFTLLRKLMEKQKDKH